MASQQLNTFLGSRFVNVLGRLLALAVVFTFFAVFVDDGKFYTARNLENILRQSCVYATAAMGMTFIIITAGIDLSAGSIIALAVVAVSGVLNLHAGGEPLIQSYPTSLPLLAVVTGILVSTAAGAFNGSVIVGLRLVPFIVTLGTMGMFRGLAKGMADEQDIYPPVDTWITNLMDPTLTNPKGGWQVLPWGVWILIASLLVTAFILRYTRFGRHVYAVGSNEETARLCGVNVGRTKILVYTLAGFFCGLAGLMQFSFIDGIGQPTTAVMYELFIIAAVIIGGASFSGGEGSVFGSVIGALIITILYMGGQQMHWPKWVQEMVIGGIIISAVAIDQLRHRKLSS
jgi:ribose transport system permease protein/erythritol transport system permease protein